MRVVMLCMCVCACVCGCEFLSVRSQGRVCMCVCMRACVRAYMCEYVRARVVYRCTRVFVSVCSSFFCWGMCSGLWMLSTLMSQPLPPPPSPCWWPLGGWSVRSCSSGSRPRNSAGALHRPPLSNTPMGPFDWGGAQVLGKQSGKGVTTPCILYAFQLKQAVSQQLKEGPVLKLLQL